MTGLQASPDTISERPDFAAPTFLEAVFSATPDCIKIVAPDGRLLRMNPAGLRMIEADGLEAVQGGSVFDLVAPGDREAWIANHHRICGGEAMSWEFNLIGLAGARRRMETHSVPLPGPDGALCHLAVTRDITRRTADEAALRESERRSRELLEALPTAVYTTDAAGKITFYNEAAVEFWGCRPELGEDQWCGSWRLYTPDGAPLPHDECPMAVALKEDRPVRDEEAVAERPDGGRVAFRAYPTPLHDASGALTGAVNMLVDISQHKEAEARHRLLINELNHRVKNSLASVQSIVTQTLRRADDTETARAAVEARLVALARAHDLLTEESWRSASARGVVLASLRGHCGDASRLEVDGPDVQLTPKTALALSMAMHELCANALEHGALSADAGRIAVAWRVQPEADDDPRLVLDWQETGGPAVNPPARLGFGARLIEWGLSAELGGEARLSFPAEGVRCHIDIPLSRPA